MKNILTILCSLSIGVTTTSGIVSCNQQKCEYKIFGNWKQLCKKDKPFNENKPTYKWYLLIYFNNYNKYYIDRKFWDGTVDTADNHKWRPDLIGWSTNWKEVYIWTKNTIPTDKDVPKIDDNGNIII